MAPPSEASIAWFRALGVDLGADKSSHTVTHVHNAASPNLICSVCKWNFDDLAALHLHKAQTGHGVPTTSRSPPNFTCEKCKKTFVFQSNLDEHRKPPYVCKEPSPEPEEMPVFCDRCHQSFSTQERFNQHRSDLASKCADWQNTPPKKKARSRSKRYVDWDRPRNGRYPSIHSYDDPPPTSDTSTLGSNGELQCKVCKMSFKSEGHYNNHFLACIPVGPRSQLEPIVEAPSGGLCASPAGTGTHVCNSYRCGKTFRSEAGLAQHKADIHGVGGRERTPWGLGTSNISAPDPPLAARQPNVPAGSRAPAKGPMSPTSPGVMSVSTHMGSVADMEQARQVHDRALRLLIQSDIFIHYSGKVSIDGTVWTRISVVKQSEAVAILDTMCHLPKGLQNEYLPMPKTFMDEYKAHYEPANFISLSLRDPGKPGLNAVVLSCSKVVLAGGRHEIVKIAAIDLSTCGILMNHLVCTNRHMNVTDWRSSVTGLSSWLDMAAAQQAGYKVFKGWAAARTALQQYIDSETILVGHNLRADLDALRIIHGRGVDIVKVVEKAASGPLTKAQLRLDSLYRDYLGKTLPSGAQYGRHGLVDAFAIREFVLWTMKNRAQLDKIAKQKSSDYQRVLPPVHAAAPS